jgi:hypothetical protein
MPRKNKSLITISPAMPFYKLTRHPSPLHAVYGKELLNQSNVPDGQRTLRILRRAAKKRLRESFDSDVNRYIFFLYRSERHKDNRLPKIVMRVTWHIHLHTKGRATTNFPLGETSNDYQAKSYGSRLRDGCSHWGKCVGGNSCKGLGECKTATNSCLGRNSCKGKGFKEMNKADCVTAGGEFA